MFYDEPKYDCPNKIHFQAQKLLPIMIKLISNLDGGTTCTTTGRTDISANTALNLMLLTNLRTL